MASCRSFSLAALLVLATVAQQAYAQRGRGDRGGDRGGDKGSGSGDPIISAFDGTVFEFMGQPGKFYNLVSDYGVYQLSTLLKPAQLGNHNGTYMDSIAFKARNAEVIVKAATDNNMAVTVNGFPMDVEKLEDFTQQVEVEGGDTLSLRWRKFWPAVGEALFIHTGGVEVLVSLTPAGRTDFAGIEQPSYLNFNFTLLQAPNGELQGVVGETYGYMESAKKNHAVSKDGSADVALVKPSNQYPLYPDSAYELDSFFSAPRLSIVKGGQVSKAERARVQRSLVDVSDRKMAPGAHAAAARAALSFPLTAAGGCDF